MKPKTAAELQERIREMQSRINSQAALIHRYGMDRMQLALLAATGPTFTNPIAAMKAETLRDRILEEMGLNLDGTLMEVPRG